MKVGSIAFQAESAFSLEIEILVTYCTFSSLLSEVKVEYCTMQMVFNNFPLTGFLFLIKIELHVPLNVYDVATSLFLSFIT